MDRRTFLRAPHSRTSAFHADASNYAVASRSRAASRDVTAELLPIPASAPLGTEFSGPLGPERARHLLNRTVFGGSPASVRRFAAMTASEALETLIKEDPAVLDTPEWINEARPKSPKSARKEYDARNSGWRNELRNDWMVRLGSGSLRERMTLFWHNHFVAELRKYRLAVYGHRYMSLLRENALGSIEPMIRQIGIEPAMLIYLDGQKSHKRNPNENYARELLELFTMGQFGPNGELNYTQEDITEVARALTGWRVDQENITTYFHARRHDTGSKTVFGKTFEDQGEGDYDRVIDLILSERREAVAHRVARELYMAFVYQAPNQQIVSELAKALLDHDLQVGKPLMMLLSSQHFYQDDVRNTRIKSPLDLLLGLTRSMDGAVDRKRFTRFSNRLGQQILDPPNVSGWDGHRAWLDTNTLPSRWGISWSLVNKFAQVDLGQWLDSVRETYPELPSIDDAEFGFKAPAILIEALHNVPLDRLDLPEMDGEFQGNITDNPVPDYVSGTTADLAKVFYGRFRWYRWDRLSLDRKHRFVRNFLRFGLELPEFQLT